MTKVDEEQVKAMKDLLSKLDEANANLPSDTAPRIINAVSEFMQQLTIMDCEIFARDIRRTMDDILESKLNINTDMEI